MLGAPSAKAHRDGLEQIAIFLQLLDGSFDLKKGKIPQSGDVTGVPGGSQVLFFFDITQLQYWGVEISSPDS